ncbi:MAG: hypothetical protein KTR26_04545 [Flammeovirgaceae bacterium]|nr:hypothetical protein [Flammeovirgaceae bacterium]
MARNIIFGILSLLYLLKCASLIYGYLDGYYWESLSISGFLGNFQKHVSYGFIEIIVMLIGAFGFFGKSLFRWILLSLYPYLVIGVGLIFLLGFNQTDMNYRLSHLIFAYILLILLNLPPLIKGFKFVNLETQLLVNLIGFICGIILAFLFF